MRAKFRVTKKETKTKKPRESDISRIRRDAPNGATVMSFGMWGDIADIITHAKFYFNRLGIWGF